MADVGKNIRKFRTKRHMTQDDLAERLFVSRQTVSNYETGKSNPDLDTLLKIAEVLETDVDGLIFGPPDLAGRRKDIRRLGAAGCVLALLSALNYVLGLWNHFLTRDYFAPYVGFPTALILQPILLLLGGWGLLQLAKILWKAKPLRRKWVRPAFFAVLLLLILYFLGVLPLCAEMSAAALGFPPVHPGYPPAFSGEIPAFFPEALFLWSCDFSYLFLDAPPTVLRCLWLFLGAVLWNGPGPSHGFSSAIRDTAT